MAKETKIKKKDDLKIGEDFTALVKRIDKGDPKPEDLKALSTELDENPQIYRLVGNLQSKIYFEILSESTNSLFLKQCVERYIEEMKVELGYQNSTFVEKMLIDEIIMRWLRLQTMESYHKNVSRQSHSLEQGMYIDKRLDLAQKRFLRSITTLQKVRKMIAQTEAKSMELLKKMMKNS